VEFPYEEIQKLCTTTSSQVYSSPRHVKCSSESLRIIITDYLSILQPPHSHTVLNDTQDWLFYVYWIVHHLDSWITRDQLDVTCFIISLFTAQHVSDVNTSNLRSLRLIWWVIAWVVWFWFDVCWCCVVVVWYPMLAEVLVFQPAYGYHTTTTQHQHTSNQNHTTHAITHKISRQLLRMDVLTSETRWAVNNEIIKQVTSSWSLHQVGLSLFNYSRLTTLINWKQVTVRSLLPGWSYVYFSRQRLNFKCSVTAVSIHVFSSKLVTIILIVISWNNCTKAPMY